MVPDLQDLRAALIAALGAERLSDDPADLGYYGADRCRGGWPVQPSFIVFPRSAADVQAVVRACAAHGVPIVPSGGRTGLAGAATATRGEVVLSLERMHRILEVDTAARTLRCEAGATLQAVQDAAAAAGLLYPVDYAAKGSAQIGGSLATNAGGVKVLRYGLTRDWVLGLKVVLASGELLALGGALVKNNTGYDLRQLFIGSEGTLGVIVEVTLKLARPPADSLVALCAVPSDAEVLALFARLRRSSLTLSAFEFLDHGCLGHVLAHRKGDLPFAEVAARYVLVEVEVPVPGAAALEHTRDELGACLGEAVDAGEVADAVLAATQAQARALWAYREDISESLHRHTPHKADIALPVARVAEFLAAWRPLVAERLPGIEALCFGHVGDGNLHLNLLRPDATGLPEFLDRVHAFDDELYALVQAHDGSISAEHGVGLLKRDHLHYSRNPTEVALMRGIKSVLDPAGLLNPGKIF
ncbi:FAD-binding oxidoreductase [Nannocystis pusilla]|uniref:FAD-binding oxidoreductase n=1 Tax=Nannocystis pusilla TaxID=889268 RepID=UPI003BF1FDD3